MGRSADVVRELFEHGLTGGRRDVIDRLCVPDASYHQPGVPRGMEGLGLIVELENDAFAGWCVELEELIECGERVAVRWTARGRHENTYVGEGPTNREVELTGISIYGLRDGLIVEAWSSPDSLGLLQQIGVVPEMALLD